jgi:DNA-binding transcriptional LysR family regulator
MNIETLRIFCDVVQHQSFSRGANVNEVSQSAATQSVHRVEKHFGVDLVDRSKRPFVLTPEGQACYEGFEKCSSSTIPSKHEYDPCGWKSAGQSA